MLATLALRVEPYQLACSLRPLGGARMIYSVIEHPCCRGRNKTATPTVRNVRAAPPPPPPRHGQHRGPRMFMLLPPRLYLVVALALRCFFPVAVVVVVVVDVATATVGIRSQLTLRSFQLAERSLLLNIPVN